VATLSGYPVGEVIYFLSLFQEVREILKTCNQFAEWATPLTEKERVCLRFHSRTLSQPGLDYPEFVTP
jgi:hypothetical protein